MKDEEIIRLEAKKFFDLSIDIKSQYIVEEVRNIKRRLSDFYSDEFKAIFLDEINIQISTLLENHRIKAHHGQAKSDCDYEINCDKLSFYIRQEIGTLPRVAHQPFKTNPEQVRNRVFISYSHFDKEFLSDIQRHFKPFLKQINFWDDTKIEPGQKWKEEIRNAINQTKVAILLVSTDFLGSDFISTHELPPLLKAAEENGAVILTVILKPCLFEEFTELNQFQTINPPSKPLTKMDITEREDTLVNMVRQTKRILEGV